MGGSARGWCLTKLILPRRRWLQDDCRCGRAQGMAGGMANTVWRARFTYCANAPLPHGSVSGGVW